MAAADRVGVWWTKMSEKYYCEACVSVEGKLIEVKGYNNCSNCTADSIPITLDEAKEILLDHITAKEFYIEICHKLGEAIAKEESDD